MNNGDLTLGARLFASLAVATPTLFAFLFGMVATQPPGERLALGFRLLGQVTMALVLVGAAWSFGYVTRSELLDDRERRRWQAGTVLYFVIAPQVVWFKLLRHDPRSHRTRSGR